MSDQEHAPGDAATPDDLGQRGRAAGRPAIGQRRNFWVPNALWAALRAAAQDRDQSVSALVRTICREWLRREYGGE